MNMLNKVLLHGNLVKDPESRDLPNGQVASFRIANSRDYKNKNGQDQSETTYVDIQTFGKLAVTCRQFLSKGSGVIIEGHLHLDHWQGKDGQEKFKLAVIAESVQFLYSSKKENNPPRPPADNFQGRSSNRRPVDNTYAPPPMPETDGDYPQPDDDIPF